MQLTIKIKLDNAAFTEGGSAEVGRILAKLVGRLPDPLENTGGKLRLMDVNGNHVGDAQITGRPLKEVQS